MPNIEQIDNNDALKEEEVKDDSNQKLLDEMEANKNMEGDEKSPVKNDVQEKDIKEGLIDTTNPQKIDGAYTDQKAFSRGANGNTFEYEDTLKRAEDYKESVESKEENVDSAVKTVENTEDELKDIEKKESEVKAETQVEVPQEEEVPVEENPIPEGEEERVQMDAVDTDHKEQVLAFRREEDVIDNETVEKLNTLAA